MRPIRINVIEQQDGNINKSRLEKLHIETGIYVKNLIYVLKIIHDICNEVFGFSKEVKGLFYLYKTLLDLRINLSMIIIVETETAFPALNVYERENNTQLESFIRANRSYKINFNMPLFEKIKSSLSEFHVRRRNSLNELSLRQDRAIERTNILIIETIKQLNMLITSQRYNKTDNRALFLAIDRFGKWYKQSKKIFDKSSKHCDKMRKIIRLCLLARKFDQQSTLYGLPREIILIIFNYVW